MQQRKGGDYWRGSGIGRSIALALAGEWHLRRVFGRRKASLDKTPRLGNQRMEGRR
jgi:hypothetical protein